jgi:hypothetical protein
MDDSGSINNNNLNIVLDKINPNRPNNFNDNVLNR